MTEQANPTTELLTVRYPLRLDFGPIYEQERKAFIEAEEVDEVRQAEAAQLIWAEIAKYPPELFENIGIKTIRALQDIKSEGNTGYGFHLAGTLSPNIYLSVVYKGMFNSVELPPTFHHELSHGADVNNYLTDNWVSFNPNGINSYVGPNGLRGLNHFARGPKGFIYNRNTINVPEDRALVVETMMVKPFWFQQLCTEDPIIASKVAKCKLNFLTRSNGRMDDEYWQDLEGGKVDCGYWFR